MTKQRYIANDGQPYTVSPYTLIWDGDYYYMRGFCDERQEMRNFRLDRIAEQPKILNQIVVIPPEGYTPADYSKHVFRMYDTDEPVSVQLCCHVSVMKYLIDKFGNDFETVVVDDEHFKATVCVCTSTTFYSWVFGFGGDIEILYPLAIRKAFKKELHNMLMRQKAKCYFFPHTETEVTSILTAYQRTIEGKNHSWRTLEGLDRKKYSSAGVERLKQSWPRILEASYGIKLKSTPEYSKKADGSVDETDILDEREIRTRIQEQAHHYSQDNLDRDMESVLAIHRLRAGFSCTEIESSKAVFVTNNYDLSKAFNRYYRSNVNGKAFSPVITASELSAIAWIKGGSIGSIPETQLLVNAYAALQPIPELLERFSDVLDQMQTEGKISADAALAMRTSHYVRRELWQTTFGDETATSESTILSIKEKYDHQVLRDHLQTEELEKKKRQEELFKKVESQAIDEGRDAKNKFLFSLRKISKVICTILILLSLGATIISWGNLTLGIVWGILFLINCLALYDVWKTREQMLDAFLVWIANQQETKVVEKKKAEYLKLIANDRNN